jgi:hypothetical protein
MTKKIVESKKDSKKKEQALNELAESLKSSIKKSQTNKVNEVEESDLEEDVDDKSIALQNIEFHQFMNALETEPGSPALERMALSAPRPIFVGGMSQAGIEEDDSKDGFKYVSGTGNANEPKYIETNEPSGNPMERVNINSMGRRPDSFSQVDQNALFKNSELKRFESQDTERPERVERFDAEREGRKNSWERQESTFERYKPKVPKG